MPIIPHTSGGTTHSPVRTPERPLSCTAPPTDEPIERRLLLAQRSSRRLRNPAAVVSELSDGVTAPAAAAAVEPSWSERLALTAAASALRKDEVPQSPSVDAPAMVVDGGRGVYSSPEEECEGSPSNTAMELDVSLGTSCCCAAAAAVANAAAVAAATAFLFFFLEEDSPVRPFIIPFSLDCGETNTASDTLMSLYLHST